ncbi:MAG: pilus assembly protein TadG-related protein [Pseudomonadota bacterium]
MAVHRGALTRRLLADQRGQTTIFVALAAMVLVCFLAFMVNVGQLVHDKILAQNIADMVTLSAANVQAAGLNEIADLNREYYALDRDLYKFLPMGSPWQNAGQAQNLVMFFQNFMTINAAMQQAASTIYAGMAHVAAWRVLAWHNREYGGSRPFNMEIMVHPVYPGFRLTAIDHIGQRQQIYSHLVYSPIAPLVPAGSFIPIRVMPVVRIVAYGIPAAGAAFWDGWMKRDEETATYYRVRVWRPPIKPFMNLAELGFDVEIPTMEATSLAMPTGGNIENRKSNYIARFAPVKSEFKFDYPLLLFRDRYLH